MTAGYRRSERLEYRPFTTTRRRDSRASVYGCTSTGNTYASFSRFFLICRGKIDCDRFTRIDRQSSLPCDSAFSSTRSACDCFAVHVREYSLRHYTCIDVNRNVRFNDTVLFVHAVFSTVFLFRREGAKWTRSRIKHVLMARRRIRAFSLYAFPSNSHRLPRNYFQ